jgi:adenosylhomocysteine nucleosidase
VRVLITYAVEPEFAPWRELRTLVDRKIGSVTVSTAQIGRASVDFVVSGMGRANAERVAGAAMAEPHTICIAAGFCGSLKEEHRLGDILVPDGIQEVDGTKTLECGQNLVVGAWEEGAKRVKRFFTVREVVSSADEKARLAPYADAVDMESFAVLSAARARNLSAVAIRVVSDRHDQDVPAECGTTVDEQGRVSVRGVVRMVAQHPLQLPALIRLGRQSKTAAEGLAHFLEAYIKKLSFHSHGWPPAEVLEVAAR